MFGPCTLAVACFTLKVDLRDLGHLDGSPVESKDCRRLDDHSVLQSAGECGPPRNLKVKIIFQTIKIFQKKFEHIFLHWSLLSVILFASLHLGVHLYCLVSIL